MTAAHIWVPTELHTITYYDKNWLQIFGQLNTLIRTECNGGYGMQGKICYKDEGIETFGAQYYFTAMVIRLVIHPFII